MSSSAVANVSKVKIKKKEVMLKAILKCFSEKYIL